VVLRYRIPVVKNSNIGQTVVEPWLTGLAHTKITAFAICLWPLRMLQKFSAVRFIGKKMLENAKKGT